MQIQLESPFKEDSSWICTVYFKDDKDKTTTTSPDDIAQQKTNQSPYKKEGPEGPSPISF
jgi:hypothetical protein